MNLVGRGLAGAALLGAFALWLRLPDAPLAVRLDESESLRRRSEWRGAYHIHSDRSDGTGSVDEIARAAADAGLDFVILTDHGNATRTPEPPSYRSAVLVIDAVEVSTTEGHYVALGLDAPAPFRLGGPAADVVDDVRWLGGFGLAAHPDSPRRSLSWRDRSATVDGLEWFNADSAWRDESRLAVAFSLLTYPLRPGGTVASLFDRPLDALGWWDAASGAGRRLITLAALDAHARLGMRGTDEDEVRGGLAIAAPSYREMFGMATNRLWLASVPTGDAAHDAGLVLDAIRRGHSYSVIDSFARPGFLRAVVTADGRRAQLGDRIHVGARVTMRVEVDGPAGAEIRLLHNGLIAGRSASPVLAVDEVATAGSYRVEVHVPASRDRHEGMPWMVTNALLAWADPDPAPAPEAAPVPGVRLDLATCRPEADPDSLAEWRAVGDDRFELRYGLARSPAPFAAVACRLPVPAATIAGVAIEASASPVMRVLTQWRAPSADRDLRWGSSARFTERASVRTVGRARMTPVGGDAALTAMDAADTLLLVLDTRHAGPGARGTVAVSRIVVATRP